MTFCKVCGNEIPDGALFCTACGTPVEADEATTVLTQDDNATTLLYRDDEATSVLTEDEGTVLLRQKQVKPVDVEEPKNVQKEGKVGLFICICFVVICVVVPILNEIL